MRETGLRCAQMGAKFAHMTTPQSRLVIDNVATIMSDRGETETSLSKTTGIPRTTLQRRLQKVSAFNTDELALIGQALGVEIVELFTQDAA